MMGVITNFVRQSTNAAAKQAAKGNKVTVHYTGKLNDKNGKLFDSSRTRGQPFSFILGKGQVIRGWDEGVLNKKEGDLFELTISPDYGYGSRDLGVIPKNSTLYFEVELLKVDN